MQKTFKKGYILLIVLFISTSLFAASVIQVRPDKVGRDKIIVLNKTQHTNLEIQIWYPVASNVKATSNDTPFKSAPEAWNAPVATKKKRPLIVISHGWAGNPQFLAWFADSLASNGFIVAIPQHLSDITTPPSNNYWRRPLDISMAISALLDSKYKNVIDANHIGFAGYSLGGATGIWLAGGIASHYELNIYPGEKYTSTKFFTRWTDEMNKHTDFAKAKESFKDPRIKAEFLISPATSWQFSQASLNAITIPIYIVEVSGDTVLIPETNAFYYAEQIPTATLKMIPGKADHFVFRAEIKADKIKEYDPTGQYSFNYIDHPSVNRAKIHDEVARLAISFFRETLK